MAKLTYSERDNQYGLLWNGVFITNARLDETGRFPVAPEYYGTVESLVLWIDKLNREIE